MAENKKFSFEERLTGWAGEANVKAAKALLKSAALTGVWRNKDGNLRGAFSTPSGNLLTTVISGTTPTSKCDCGNNPDLLCPHACAVIMYAGRFGNPFGKDNAAAPSYYQGLRHEPWDKLAGRVPEVPKARLVIEAQSEAPHAPSKWENINISVKIQTRDRDFPGNLNNLRQLYFDKSLSVVVQYDHFDLQEQQIIRFLALFGEPDGSRINLEADMTSEFFHCLINYQRFFKGGQQITIRGDRPDVVIVKNANRYYPGLRLYGALLPVSGARVITGRSGCWIGVGKEYYFISANCEVGFLRSFFRAGQQTASKDGISEEKVRRLPFEIVNLKDPEPESRPPQILLDGKLSSDDKLSLKIRYIYQLGDNEVAAPVRSGELLASGNRFHCRDTASERAFEQTLTMFGFVVDNHEAVLQGVVKSGLFIEHFLPDLLESSYSPALSPGLLKLSRLSPVTLCCRHLEVEGDQHKIGFKLSAGNEFADWNKVFEAAAKREDYVICRNAVFRISDALGAFMRASTTIIHSVNSDSCEFTVPHCNINYYHEMTKRMPEAIIPEFAISDCDLYTAPAAKGSYTFDGELRSYQKQGVDFLCRMTDRHFNVILADEMGLGKTVQLLATLGKRLDRDGDPALIIAPASLITNWVREAEKFLPGVRVIAPIGNDRSVLWKNPESYDIGVISYTAARLAGEKLKQVKFSYLVLDEAQHIKNPGSGNAKNCKGIQAAHKIVLSGTPLENSPEDLWSIFEFLQPGMLGPAASFKKRYITAGSDLPELRNELAYRISPFILRRTKQEVAKDLPERTEKLVFCDFGKEQRELYDRILAEGRELLADPASDAAQRNAAIFNTLLRLRQICCAPALLPEGRGENIPSAKEELLQELTDEMLDSSHKMLVFSQFTSMLKRITPVLKEKNIPYEYLDGSTRNRQEKVDKFNNDPDIPLFLLSLKAGGTGLNLTSADTVVIYDPWWNPAAELQAADRTHRIGQNKPVTIYKLVVRDSIEEKILSLQGRKRELFNQVIEASQDESSRLSIEELRELLEQ